MEISLVFLSILSILVCISLLCCGEQQLQEQPQQQYGRVQTYLKGGTPHQQMEIIFKASHLEGDLAVAGSKFGTDKILEHGFHRFYSRHLEIYRGVPGVAMLEIGIAQNKSLQMWLEYFPLA